MVGIFGCFSGALAQGVQNVSGSRTKVEATSVFITLGTKGGPEAEAGRSQPSNALLVGRAVYLVDTGDGSAQQLVKAGIPLAKVSGVFLSHLHFDHTGGLAAVLGLRFQMGVPGRLAIFGPPGTSELVSGLLKSMQPEARTGTGVPGEIVRDPTASVSITEILDGQTFQVGAMRISARGNTHYGPPDPINRIKRSASLSYRFDLPDRTIVYTGDTGPSRAVEELSRGADLLVSELVDVEGMEKRLDALKIPEGQKEQLIWHVRSHHLDASEVGILARTAGVKSVVLTHLAGLPPPGSNNSKYLEKVRKFYSGPVTIAEDLNRF
jgi:ribonuclease BN (tRNA processing enzyme)